MSLPRWLILPVLLQNPAGHVTAATVLSVRAARTRCWTWQQKWSRGSRFDGLQSQNDKTILVRPTLPSSLSPPSHTIHTEYYMHTYILPLPILQLVVLRKMCMCSLIGAGSLGHCNTIMSLVGSSQALLIIELATHSKMPTSNAVLVADD